MRDLRASGPERPKTLRPDERPDPNPDRPLKSDEQREAEARAKMGRPAYHAPPQGRSAHPRGSWKSPGEGAVVGRADGAVSVAFHGGASAAVPKLWGSGLGATDARAHGAERSAGANRDEIRLPDHGKRCLGTGDDGAVARRTVRAFGREIESCRVYCKTCRREIPLPEGYSDARAAVPAHAVPAVASHGADDYPIPVRRETVEVRGKIQPAMGRSVRAIGATADPAIVRVKDVRLKGTLDNCGAIRAVEVTGGARGLRRAIDLYRDNPIVGSVATTGTVVYRVARPDRAADPFKVAAPVRSVRGTVGTDEIAAARVRRDANRPVLCDALPRTAGNVVAF